MIRKPLVLAALALASFSSFADDITLAPEPVLTAARAQVQAETLTAVRADTLRHAEGSGIAPSFKSEKTRAQVGSELSEYTRSGEKAAHDAATPA